MSTSPIVSITPKTQIIPPWRRAPCDAVTLGPVGTFAEEASRKEFHPMSALSLVSKIEKIYDAVESKRVPYGLVPIENSTEGVVTASLDRLMASSCKIVGERCLTIQHNLLTHASALLDIKTVYGHPQALAQCKGWLEQNLPTAAIIAATSNAEGARLAANSNDTAAIASERAAELYALPLLKGQIQDRRDNTTKFYVMSNQLHDRALDNTTVLRASVPHCTGGLLTLLRPFADDGINLLSLHARPNKQKCWEYDFMIIADCNHKNPALHRAVKATVKSGSRIKFLGGYQRE